MLCNLLQTPLISTMSNAPSLIFPEIHCEMFCVYFPNKFIRFLASDQYSRTLELFSQQTLSFFCLAALPSFFLPWARSSKRRDPKRSRLKRNHSRSPPLPRWLLTPRRLLLPIHRPPLLPSINPPLHPLYRQASTTISSLLPVS